MEKKRVGILGGAGYTGGELVRLLIQHPGTTLVAVQSRSQAGKSIASVHHDLLGETDLIFVESMDAHYGSLDVLFLALPHGETKAVLASGSIPDHIKIIDLSQDFRLKSHAKFGKREFIYGLPERYREEIKHAKNVANPGCFATAIQAALLPLAKSGKLGEAYVTGITGSTGAGVKLASTSHFSFRANNIQAYKTLSHQHIAEVEETLHSYPGSSNAKVSFVPWRGDFTRGIFVSALVESKLNQAEAFKLYRDYFEGHPFVTVTTDAIDLKSVVNTNKVFIEVNQEGSKLAIHVAIDNLLKGASGQAVQNYNLMSGFPETTGLKLKGIAF
jgi:N-acetyl-gamma-glutamyl-phosphate reductase